MRASVAIVLVLGCLVSGPVFAQSSNDGGGTGAVAGEGPGGSGAGQTSGGPAALEDEEASPSFKKRR